MSFISVRNVSVQYPLFSEAARSAKSSIFQLFGGSRAAPGRCVNSLVDVSVEIEPGDRLCLIGVNGSGKTSLLRAIAGVLPVQTGVIQIGGRISALLDFATGFEMEMSGYDNILARGMFLGYSIEEMMERREAIVEFADIGDFIQEPLKTYSSGMFVRLAFAIATSIDPDILLVDEIVGAGDITFANKAQRRMLNVIDRGNIVVMATHSTDLAVQICNKGLWLHHGRVRAYGEVRSVIEAYGSTAAK